MFKKVEHRAVPGGEGPTAPRYHGRHLLNRHPDGLEKCVGCELCAWACPADAIFVEGADNTDEERFSPGERYGRVYQINYLRCIGCGLCIEACPTRALTMTNEYELADDSRADLIYEKDRLLAPLRARHGAPPHAMVPGHDDEDYYLGASGTRAAPATARPNEPDVDRRGGRSSGSWRRRGARARWAWSRARKAVHSALLLAMTMVFLAIFYIAQGAVFLGVVQVVVYTGAVMMLFLFVLMLVGVDSSDSLVETLRGQRVAAVVVGVGFGLLLIAGSARFAVAPRASRRPTRDGNVEGLAELIFARYVWAFEVTSALLITAAIGAMVLAHRERFGPTPAQRGAVAGTAAELGQGRRKLHADAEPRCVRPAQRGGHPGAAARRHVRRVVGVRQPDPSRGEHHPARRAPGTGKGWSVNPANYLYLSALLFTIGAAGVLLRRNAIVVFMCVELMLNATNLAFVTFARMHGNLDGQVFAFFIMVVAAAEVVVGLAIIMTIFRTRRSASVDDADLLRH